MVSLEELLKEGEEYQKRIQSGFKDIVEIEMEYLKKLETHLNEVNKENENLKAQLSRLKEDKEENERVFERLFTHYKERIQKLKDELNTYKEANNA